jgi:hypothetical protein
LKPVQLHLGGSAFGVGTTGGVEKIVTHYCEPELSYLYGPGNDISSSVKLLDQYFKNAGLAPDKIDPEDLYKLLKGLFGKNKSVSRSVGSVSNNERYVRGPKSILDYICSNSFNRERIIVSTGDAKKMAVMYNLERNTVPSNVIKYSELYWTRELIYEAGLESYMNGDLDQEMANLARDVGDTWQFLITSANNKYVDRLSYYYCWTREQVKVGGMWKGEGTLLFKTPEMYIQIHMFNRSIRRILVKIKGGQIGTVTNWYIESVISAQVNLIAYTEPASSYSIEKEYLVHDGSRWSFGGQPSRNGQILEVERGLETPYWCDSETELVRESGVLTLRTNNNRKLNIHTAVSDCVLRVDTVKKYMDTDLIRKKREVMSSSKRSKLESSLRSLRVSLLGRPRYSVERLTVTPHKTMTAKVMAGYERSSNDRVNGRGSFVRALVYMKDKIPDLGFPSIEDYKQWSSRGLSVYMPPSMRDAFEENANYTMDSNQLEVVQDKIYGLLSELSTDPVEWSTISSLFKKGTESSLACVLMKDAKAAEVINHSHHSKFPHLEWLHELTTAISSICQERGSHNQVGGVKVDGNLVYKLTAECLKTFGGKGSLHCVPGENLDRVLEMIIDDELLRGLNSKSGLSNAMTSIDFSKLGKERFVRMYKNLVSLSSAYHAKDVKKLRGVASLSRGQEGRFRKALINHTFPVVRLYSAGKIKKKKSKGGKKSRWEFTTNRSGGRSESRNEKREVSLTVVNDACYGWFKGVKEELYDEAEDRHFGSEDIEDLETEIIPYNGVAFYQCEYLSRKDAEKYGSSSSCFLVQCRGYDRSLDGGTRKVTIYEEDMAFPKSIIVSTGERRFVIEGYRLRSSPLRDAMEPNFEYKRGKWVGSEIFKIHNHKLRESLAKTAESKLSVKGNSVSLVKKNMGNIIFPDNASNVKAKSVIREAVAQAEAELTEGEAAAGGVEAKESLGNVGERKKSVAELISEIIKGKSEDKLEVNSILMEMVDERRSYIPDFGFKVRSDDKDLMTDQDIIAEMDIMSFDLAREIVAGDLEITSQDKSQILTNLRFGTILMEGMPLYLKAPQKILYKIIAMVISEAKIVRSSNSPAGKNLCNFTQRLVSKDVEDEDDILGDLMRADMGYDDIGEQDLDFLEG